MKKYSAAADFGKRMGEVVAVVKFASGNPINGNAAGIAPSFPGPNVGYATMGGFGAAPTAKFDGPNVGVHKPNQIMGGAGAAPVKPLMDNIYRGKLQGSVGPENTAVPVNKPLLPAIFNKTLGQV